MGGVVPPQMIWLHSVFMLTGVNALSGLPTVQIQYIAGEQRYPDKEAHQAVLFARLKRRLVGNFQSPDASTGRHLANILTYNILITLNR